jgi:hypothetical protein
METLDLVLGFLVLVPVLLVAFLASLFGLVRYLPKMKEQKDTLAWKVLTLLSGNLKLQSMQALWYLCTALY